MRLNVDCQIGRSPSLTCCGGAIVPRRHKGEAETPVVPSLSVGCSLALQGRRTTTRHCLLGGLMGSCCKFVLLAEDVPWTCPGLKAVE